MSGPVGSHWTATSVTDGTVRWRSRNERWTLVLTRPTPDLTVVDAQDTHTGREYTMISSAADGLERFDFGVPLFVAQAMLRAASYTATDSDDS